MASTSESFVGRDARYQKTEPEKGPVSGGLWRAAGFPGGIGRREIGRGPAEGPPAPLIVHVGKLEQEPFT